MGDLINQGLYFSFIQWKFFLKCNLQPIFLLILDCLLFNICIFIFGCIRSYLQASLQLWLAGMVALWYAGLQFSDQGLNLSTLHWERGILAIEHSEKFPLVFLCHSYIIREKLSLALFARFGIVRMTEEGILSSCFDFLKL